MAESLIHSTPQKARSSLIQTNQPLIHRSRPVESPRRFLQYLPALTHSLSPSLPTSHGDSTHTQIITCRRLDQ